jgi:putative redox protein
MKSTHASVRYAGDDLFVGTTPSGHSLAIDIKGERSDAPGPLELLLVSLGGCTAADVVSVLKKKREKVTSYRVEIHGERREEHPRSYRRIEVRHIVHGIGISEKSVAQAVTLSTEKYCSVAGTLRPTAEIVSTWEIHEEDAANLETK